MKKFYYIFVPLLIVKFFMAMAKATFQNIPCLNFCSDLLNFFFALCVFGSLIVLIFGITLSFFKDKFVRIDRKELMMHASIILTISVISCVFIVALEASEKYRIF